MLKVEKACQFIEQIARDDSHGYDQIHRQGPDYDCSSLVIKSYDQAGLPVKDNGATYTGNMYTAFVKSGFKDVTGDVNLATGSGLERGDVLLNIKHHTALYCGNGKEAEASINEKGTAKGGQVGDQTGREILIRSYRNYPWDVVLRYDEVGWVYDEGKGWWYRHSGGSYPLDCWACIDDDWYYFDKHGYALHDEWEWIDGKCYFFKPDCRMAANAYIQSTTNKNLYHWVNTRGEWEEKHDSWDIYKNTIITR